MHMDHTLPNNDNIIVTEIHEYRDNVIRSVLFTDLRTIKDIRTLDRAQHAMMRYYNGLGIVKDGRMKIDLAHVLTFLRTKKRNALFFRSVQML